MPMPMQQDLRERLMARTEAELVELDRWVRGLMHESRPEELASGGDNTPLSEVADALQVGGEQQARSELLGRLIEKSARLEQALRRMREGSYGTCISCEKPIHIERLEAIPETPYCLACQRRLERPPGSVHHARAG